MSRPEMASKRCKKCNNQQKTSGLNGGRWDEMRAQWRVQGECDPILLGAIKLGEWGKLR